MLAVGEILDSIFILEAFNSPSSWSMNVQDAKLAQMRMKYRLSKEFSEMTATWLRDWLKAVAISPNKIFLEPHDG